jgi:hypothetical protein
MLTRDRFNISRHPAARLRWAMNHRLAQIGIDHAEHRTWAIDIGQHDRQTLTIN